MIVALRQTQLFWENLKHFFTSVSLLKTLNLTVCEYKSVLLCPNVYENELSRLAQPTKSTMFFCFF